MAQRKQIKPRKCNVCQCLIDTTAKGIMDHAAKCTKLPELTKESK